MLGAFSHALHTIVAAQFIALCREGRGAAINRRDKSRRYGNVRFSAYALNTGNPRWKVARTGEMRATASAEQLASTSIMLASSSTFGH